MSTDEPDWTEPGTWPVAPGVARIPLPMPGDGLRAVNVYAIDDGRGELTLIDGGWAVDEALPVLDAGLARLGRSIEDVGTIAVTHVHRDHYTLALRIREMTGATLLLGEGERASIDAIQDHWGLGYRPYRDRLLQAGADGLADDVDRQFAGSADADRPEPEYSYPDRWLAAGDTIMVGDRALQAIATPGHTTGHFVFADIAGGLLFSGDHVLPRITPSIAFEPVPGELALGEFLGSLERMRALPDLAMMPSHGAAGGSVHDRAEALIAHHDERLAAMVALVARAKGPMSGAEVAAGLPWTRRKRRLDELDPFNRMLAINETVHHLDLLVHRRQLDHHPGAVPRYSGGDPRSI